MRRPGCSRGPGPSSGRGRRATRPRSRPPSTPWSRCNAHLAEHLDEEEAEVLPLAAENLSAEEWGALPGHGMANFHGDKIWLILGLIRERMNDEQRAAMLEHMPPPAVEMWTGFGEQAFRDYAAVVTVQVGDP